jgi:hypothetical protein
VRNTTAATRRTLATDEDLGRQGVTRLTRADADLCNNGPPLLQTLQSFDAVIAKLDNLVDHL